LASFVTLVYSGAGFNFTRLKPKYVLNANIAHCFDRIPHDTLIQKLHTIRPVECLVRDRLKAKSADRSSRAFHSAT